MLQSTFVMIKPDAVVRGIVGEITTRLERKGLRLVASKMIVLTTEMLNEHYSHLVGKPFFARLVDFIQATPVLLQVWRGADAVLLVRTLAGVTNGRDAAPGTIRGDFSQSVQSNLIHASDSTEAAAIEIKRFFNDNEIHDYVDPLTSFLLAEEER